MIQNSVAFQANAHLYNCLGTGAQSFIRSSGLIGFEPAGEYFAPLISQQCIQQFSLVRPQTRFCDFTAEDKTITVYALADLGTPSLMARVRALEAEKENLRLGATQSEYLTLDPPYLN